MLKIMPKSLNNFISFLFLLLPLVFLSSCSSRLEKLDEKILYNKDDLTVKIAIYQEELFLHYSGKVFKILCKSPETEKYSNYIINEPKWMVIGNGSVPEKDTLDSLVIKYKDKYNRSSCITRK